MSLIETCFCLRLYSIYLHLHKNSYSTYFPWIEWYILRRINGHFIVQNHGLEIPGEEFDFTARPKIKSQSWIFWYGQSIFCLPHWSKISDFFDFCLHWVSVVRVQNNWILKIFGLDRSDSLQFTTLIILTLVSMVKG